MGNKKEKDEGPKVTDVISLANGHLLLTFDNLEMKVYDCRPWLDEQKPPFSLNMFYYAACANAKGGISWGGCYLISAEVLYRDSVPLLDFLNKMLGGEKQKDPYFDNYGDKPSDSLQSQMGRYGQSRYIAGKQDTKDKAAKMLTKFMTAENIDTVDMVMWIKFILDVDLDKAVEYYINFRE